VDPSKVVLYKGTNYANEFWEVPAANDVAYMIPTTSPVRNEASSIKIPPGYNYYLRIYDADNCTGTERAYTSSVSDLSGSGLNNDVACVRLRIGAPSTTPTSTTPTSTTPTGSVILYREPNYGGASWTVPGVGQHTIPTSSSVRNEATSIRVPTGYYLQVFDSDTCTGTTRSYTRDIADLNGSGINNDIACVRLSYL
jgi:hypothetical protein